MPWVYLRFSTYYYYAFFKVLSYGLTTSTVKSINPVTGLYYAVLTKYLRKSRKTRSDPSQGFTTHSYSERAPKPVIINYQRIIRVSSESL